MPTSIVIIFMVIVGLAYFIPPIALIIGSIILFGLFLYNLENIRKNLTSNSEDYPKFSESYSKSSEDWQLTNFLHQKYLYLQSDEWGKKRKAVLKRDKYTCQSCGINDSLEVHHMNSYSKIPNEPLTSLISLCRDCHEAQHEYYGFPSTYKDYMLWDAPLKKVNNGNR